MNDHLDLMNFIEESNRIEGITGAPTPAEIGAYEEFLELDELAIIDVEKFVKTIAAAPIRNKLGMNVRIGNHLPTPGSPKVVEKLSMLLIVANLNLLDAYEIHLRYENLHPFMDGNGRSGRIIWAWMKFRENSDPFRIPFLHRFYYDSLLFL